jgi:polyphenol oxidase
MTFSLLTPVEGLAHAFLLRRKGLAVDVERAEAVARLTPWHLEELSALGFATDRLRVAEQVHGADVAVVDAASAVMTLGVDGLLTAQRGVALGIYVADCAAVYLADRMGRAIGLVHSGKKGSELGITGQALRLMESRFGIPPEDVLVQVSPCIRPPKYEVDFAAQIRTDCLESGVLPQHFHDCGLCTGSDLDGFYSYRMELGKTGRMLALLGWPT